MKILTLLMCMFCIHITRGQDKILFTYDAAGNQTLRELCINCSSGRQAVQAIDETTIKNNEAISFYPNPVNEQLTVAWGEDKKGQINNIKVYNMNGQEIKSVKVLKNKNTEIIPFQSLPVGVYIVVMTFNNDQKESVKIIKK